MPMQEEWKMLAFTFGQLFLLGATLRNRIFRHGVHLLDSNQ